MTNRLYKIRQENANFDKQMVDEFAKRMPKLLDVLIDGMEYDKHIGSEEVAMLAEPFITNNKGEHIGFHWDYDSVISVAKSNVDFDKVDFYEYDLFVWANVKYGDLEKVLEAEEEAKKSKIIIRYAISELTDSDFPYYPASQRAYCWLKKHIEQSE